MKVVQITTDNRVHFHDYGKSEPYFGTAPEALLQGFAMLPEKVEVHVISVTRQALVAPPQLASNIWFHQPLIPKWGMGQSLFIGAISAIRNLLKSIRPDIVHGQGTERECALAAAFSGYPNVLTIHGNMRVHAKRGENKGRPYYRLAALLEGVALRRTDGVVSISSYTDDLVAPLTKRSWLLPNATEASYFESRSSPAKPPVILFVGGFDERKNPIEFIKSCGELISRSGWRLRLCGSGDPESAYMKELHELASNAPWIEIAGWKSRAELKAEMESASLLVLPTLEDNCPMVVLEAMAIGLPVAASRVGGIPDLISHGKTGMMFDPTSGDSMRSVTGELLTHSALRDTIGAAGKQEAARRFHPRVVAEAHLQIYQEVVAARSAS